MRALRKQLRKSRDEVMVGQQRLGELQDEIRRLTDTNHKLERVVGKKKLLERDQLTVQLEQTQQQLTDRMKRVAVRGIFIHASSMLEVITYILHRSWKEGWRLVTRPISRR